MYTCVNCEAQTHKWSGRCLECGKWGTLQKDNSIPSNKKSKNNKDTTPPSEVIDLSKVGETKTKRIGSGLKEVDRVLG